MGSVAYITITAAYDDLAITGTVGVDEWRGDLVTDLGNRVVGSLVNAYETLALVSARLNVER